MKSSTFLSNIRDRFWTRLAPLAFYAILSSFTTPFIMAFLFTGEDSPFGKLFYDLVVSEITLLYITKINFNKLFLYYVITCIILIIVTMILPNFEKRLSQKLQENLWSVLGLSFGFLTSFFVFILVILVA